MKNMWVKKVIAAAVTITMLTTSASTLSVMADAENTTTETETAVDSTESVSDAEQEYSRWMHRRMNQIMRPLIPCKRMNRMLLKRTQN